MSIGATVVGSMRPFSDYVMPGFRPSTIGTDVMTQVPRFNAQMRGELAGLGLQAVAAKERQEELLDFRREEFDRLARSRRHEGLLGMAGSLLGFDDSSEIATVDPTALAESLKQIIDGDNVRRQRAMVRPATYGAGVLSQMNVPDGSG